MQTAAAPHPLAYRLFFALLPPPLVADRIDMECRRLRFARSRVRKDRFHLTADLIDDSVDRPSSGIIAAMLEIGQSIVFPAIDFDLTRVSSFEGGTSALIANGRGKLRRLQAQIAALRERRGLPTRAGWQLNPHVTLGYDPRDARDAKIVPIRWHATEIVLILSYVGWTRHEILGRWALIEQLDLF